MRLIVSIMALILVAGCSLTPKVVVAPPTPPKIAKPSLTAMADCEGPVKLRSGALTQQQAEALWGVDDDHLIDCAARHKILVNYIRKRDAALTGAQK